MLIGKYNKSVMVTYLGVVFSILAIYNTFNAHLRFAMIFLMFAGICDLFDGKFANRFKRNEEEKAFGVQIDSLADMINFVATPIAIGFGLGLNHWVHLVIYCFYALAGIIRLGYFNVVSENTKGPLVYYHGLPVTYSALIFPVLYVFSFWLSTNVFNSLYAVGMGMVAFLFIVDLKIRKPRGLAYLFFIVLAIVLTSVILLVGA